MIGWNSSYSGSSWLQRPHAGLHQPGDAHRQFVDRGFGIAVFVRQHFTLFGKLDLPEHRTGRLRHDRFVRGSAAAGYGAAAPVKDTAVVLRGGTDPYDFLLRLVESPGRGHDAAILAGIGIAEHHLLDAAGLFQ